MKYLQNAIIVAALGILTAAAVYASVSVLAGTESYAFPATGEQTCPATGCTASNCHASGESQHVSARGRIPGSLSDATPR